MPKITNKRYSLHFKKGKFEPMQKEEFYQRLNKINVKPHLLNPFKYFFLILYWSARRPIQVLELTRGQLRKTTLKDIKTGEWNDFLEIEPAPRKGEKPVTIYLMFDNIPLLADFWNWAEGAPEDFKPFYMLKSKQKHTVKWKTKTGQLREKENEYISSRMWYWANKFFEIPPYFLRHNRYTVMRLNGATFEEIKTFKGAKTMASVEVYVHPDEETLRSISKNLIK